MAWAEGDVIAGGVKLHYYRRGSGLPIVAAHGFGDNGRCWTRLALALEGEYEFIAYDARYHGQSAAPEGQEGAGGSDLAKFVRALGLERPALIGHSMGAGSVAAAAGESPRDFACAILEDPGWRTAEQAAQPRPPRIDYAALAPEVIEAGVRQRNPGWDEVEFAPWVESKLQTHRDAHLALSQARFDQWQYLARAMSGLPALLITADNALGAIVTPETAARALSLCPTMEHVRLQGAGHNIRREAFDAFVTAVRDFLRRHYAP